MHGDVADNGDRLPVHNEGVEVPLSERLYCGSCYAGITDDPTRIGHCPCLVDAKANSRPAPIPRFSRLSVRSKIWGFTPARYQGFEGCPRNSV